MIILQLEVVYWVFVLL